MKNTPVALVILDGWGSSEKEEGNCMKKANLPNFNSIKDKYPNNNLITCGKVVGLPDGVMGNSEVGHENIGGGRIVTQKLTLISETVENETFFQNKVLLNAIKHVKENNSKLHLMGLISEGDVHSHLGHLYALINLAKKNSVADVILHAITDGRDDPPKAGEPLIKKVEDQLKKCSGRIATICGRYYAMDRDNRWERVERYYELVTSGKGFKSTSASGAILDAYKRADKKEIEEGLPLENSDEFILPTLITSEKDLIKDGDAVIFFNFRPDRAREISTALTQIDFDGFKRNNIPKNLSYSCLTEYDSTLHDSSTANPTLPIAFSKEVLKETNKANSLAEIISKMGAKQIRIAETEKFRHVTSFFNMGRQKEFEGEERVLIPSPKVATYDLKPEMSALEVSEKTIEAIKSKKYSLIAVNFANADMVGHTGIVEAAVIALETLDKELGKICNAILEENGTLIITADHGNADQMINEDGTIRTAHSLNPVPFILVNKELQNVKLKPEGSLADIAPTILDIMGIEKPSEMTGNSLIQSSSIKNQKQETIPQNC